MMSIGFGEHTRETVKIYEDDWVGTENIQNGRTRPMIFLFKAFILFLREDAVYRMNPDYVVVLENVHRFLTVRIGLLKPLNYWE